jgi:quercetin dioxygenase-like cupin family protein
VNIIRNGTRQSVEGPENYFTGHTRFDPIIEAPAPSDMRALVITFEPGARTAWHTHPMGQTLYVLSGKGLVQKQGGPVEDIHPGDVVWFDAGEKHWHGATPENAMTHLAIQEAKDGVSVEWLEKVTEEEYLKGR